MRYVYLVFLILFVAAVGVFAWQNLEPVELTFINQRLTASLALIVAAAYVLGMLTGWTVIGFLRRTMARVTARGQTPPAAH
jgi:uncharacterized integral membrane protein